MLTIDEAIKIQTIHNDHNPNFTDAEREEAHQLSIEALKECKKAREGDPALDGELLPGEGPE
jgi:hypothetical protein